MNKLLLFAVTALCLSGCVDMSADIAVQPDGSGVLTLEYRVLKSLYELGELDGNSARPIVPVGKADFERSVKRVDGLRLVSFSVKPEKGDAPQDKDDIVVVAKLGFSNLDALVRFLDGAGQRAVYSQENGNNKLSLVLWEEWEGIDADLSDLAIAVLEGYRFNLRFSAPKGSAQIRCFTTDGRILNASAERASISTSALIAEKNGVQMEILW
ncbi:MAG: hypothetical protein LBL06_04595 [Treponema sp.]|jgi:hypothetical protein|nr:hypothetical protein [Treponema sp.]